MDSMVNTCVVSHRSPSLNEFINTIGREVTSLPKMKLYFFISVNVETYFKWALHQHQSNLVINPMNIKHVKTLTPAKFIRGFTSYVKESYVIIFLF
jgi:hypothetical protein